MLESAVVHDTFTIERNFLATPSRVFAAFATAEARLRWFGGSDAAARYELDFRVGGRERLRYSHDNTPWRYAAQYYDISTDQRIIYSYEMYENDSRVSVSLATLEFTENGDGTTLVWTEQGAFLVGIDATGGPKNRIEGTAVLLDQLASSLDWQSPS